MLFNFRSVSQNYNLDSHINCQNDWMFLLTHQPRTQKAYCSIFQILPWEWNHIQDASSFMALAIAFHPHAVAGIYCIPDFSENMKERDRMEDIGWFGLDERTVSLICGFSVLCVVLVIVSLGIIGFFVKVGFFNC